MVFCMSKLGGTDIMEFSGKINKESYDPYYKIKFTYRDEKLNIETGCAEVIRQQPKLKITYDEKTQEKVKSADCTKLELELANMVLNRFIDGKDISSLLQSRK